MRATGLNRTDGPVRIDGKIIDGHACALTIADIGEVVVIAATAELSASIAEYLTDGALRMQESAIHEVSIGAKSKTRKL